MLLVKRRFLNTLLLAVSILPAAYAQTGSFTSASAGNWGSIVSPDSIAAGFGANFATGNTAATSLPLNTTLASSTVTITDSSGAVLPAQLYMVSPGQINYLVPATAALGKATVAVTAGSNKYTGNLEISNVSPAIFTANTSGAGLAAGQILRVSASGTVTNQSPFMVGVLDYVPTPISLSPTTDSVYLILYGTGIRRHSANPVKATINGVPVPVAFAGAQSTLPGLDQVNLGPLPQTLAGTGKTTLNIVLTVDGIAANTTTIAIQ